MAAGIAALALPLAVTGNAFASAPGDNGDVKIHQVGVAAPEQDNDPHVCHFYLDAFNFDGLQKVSWTIAPQAPGGAGSLSGSITLDSGGEGHTGALSLPDGHYKLDWTFVGEHGSAKHKVFWVACGTTDGGTGGTTGGPTGGSSSTGASSGTTVGGTGGAASAPGTTTPTSAHSTPPAPAAGSPSTPTGSLAHTGADGSALIYATLGAAALAGGGFGLRRYASTRGKA